MAAELGWTARDEGSVLSAFFYGYICTNLFGAMLCRRFGAKPVLTVAVAGFAAMTFVLPAAAAVSIVSSTHAAWYLGGAPGIYL